MRSFIALVIMAALGWWYFGSQGYSRVVDRPPADVANALLDLDIRDAPGAPGTDPTASGGVAPAFTVERGPDRVEYVVHAGSQVATRMIAHLQPVDGGKRTKVWAEVIRGPAPDDLVSPAFRSTGITLGLFAALLEDDLDKLVFKVGEWGPKCDEIMARFERRNEQNTRQHNPQTIGEGFAGGAQAAMSISAMDKDLKIAGCPQNAN